MSPDKADEKIAVVDDKGNILKLVTRGEIADNYTWRIICVWIENDNGQVLLQQRSYKKRLGPGLWTCAVEGTVEGNDTFETTANREIVEEIGLTEFKLVKANKVLYKAELGSRLAQGYKVKCNWPIEKFSPQESEVEQLKWVKRNEVIQKLQNNDPDFPKAGKVWLDMFNLV